MSLRSLFAAALLTLPVIAPIAVLQAASPLDSAPRPGYEEVDLFQALERGEITATVHVRDAEQLQLAIENRTDRELAVRMPNVFAAVPLHAQFQPGGAQQGGFPAFNQGNAAQNQGVGAPGGNNFNFGNNGQNNGGIFNVPPAKVVRTKLPCVCLEHGKDDPNPRLDYEIRPMHSVLADPHTARLVELLASSTDRRVVQLAAWHRANGVTWEQLAALKQDRARRPDRPQYSPAEIAAARKLLKHVEELVGQSEAAPRSPGELSAAR